MEFYCPACRRLTPTKYQEKHHLVPKCRKGKETEVLCCDCHDMIHHLFTEKELERTLNNIEAILSVPAFQRWVKWVGKKPNHFRINMKRKKKR